MNNGHVSCSHKVTGPYHDGENVAPHRLVVQLLGRVQDARSRVQAELSQAERVGAAQEGEGHLVLLVLVGGADLQDLAVRLGVLRYAHLVPGLGELWPVVVGVDDADKHLQRRMEKRG